MNNALFVNTVSPYGLNLPVKHCSAERWSSGGTARNKQASFANPAHRLIRRYEDCTCLSFPMPSNDASHLRICLPVRLVQKSSSPIGAPSNLKFPSNTQLKIENKSARMACHARAAGITSHLSNDRSKQMLLNSAWST